jgi:hypothetical protein
MVNRCGSNGEKVSGQHRYANVDGESAENIILQREGLSATLDCVASNEIKLGSFVMLALNPFTVSSHSQATHPI